MVGLIQSVEGLNRTKTDPPQARGKSASRQPSHSNCNSSLRLQTAGLPHQILDLPSLPYHGSQFFKINLCMCLPGSISLENPNTPLLFREEGVTQTLRRGFPDMCSSGTSLISWCGLAPSCSPQLRAALTTTISLKVISGGEVTALTNPRRKKEAGEFQVRGNKGQNCPPPLAGNPE